MVQVKFPIPNLWRKWDIWINSIFNCLNEWRNFWIQFLAASGVCVNNMHWSIKCTKFFMYGNLGWRSVNVEFHFNGNCLSIPRCFQHSISSFAQFWSAIGRNMLNHTRKWTGLYVLAEIFWIREIRYWYGFILCLSWYWNLLGTGIFAVYVILCRYWRWNAPADIMLLSLIIFIEKKICHSRHFQIGLVDFSDAAHVVIFHFSVIHASGPPVTKNGRSSNRKWHRRGIHFAMVHIQCFIYRRNP